MHRGFFDGVDLAFMVHGTSEGEGALVQRHRRLQRLHAKIIRYKGGPPTPAARPERHQRPICRHAGAPGLQRPAGDLPGKGRHPIPPHHDRGDLGGEHHPRGDEAGELCPRPHTDGIIRENKRSTGLWPGSPWH